MCGEPPFTLSEYADAFEADDTKEYDDMLRKAFGTMWHADWETTRSKTDEEVIQ